ncbi:MAG: PAS domain S-box protein [Ignavibacteriaceae bacterium]|jgi:PAS domain S-box-containing protein
MNRSEENKKNSRDLTGSLLLHSILDTPQELIFFALDLNYCYTAFTTFHRTIMKNIWGVDIEIGMNMLEMILSPEDCQKAKNNFDRTLRGENFILEEDYGDKNLLRTFYYNHYNPIKNKDGKVVGLSVLVIDQTKNKLAEQILRKSEENLSVTLQSIGDAVISTDVDGRVTRMNPVAEKLCGCKFSEAEGKSLTEVFRIINSDTRETVENPLAIVLQTGNIVGLANHTILISRDGSEYQIADSAAPIKNANGKMLGIILVFSDVTEKYNVQKTLAESEEKYRALAETAGDIIITYTPKGEITYLNQAALEITNLTSENYLGTSLMNFIPPKYYDKLAQNLRERKAGFLEKRIFEMELLDKNGKEFPVEVASTPIISAGEITGFLSIARNITERKLAEEKLKTNEKKFRLLIENAIDLVFTVNSEGFLTYISPSAKQFGGYDEIEELGKHFSGYLADKNQLEKFSQAFQEILEGQISLVLELFFLPKDRKPFWAEVTAKPLVVNNKVVEIHCVLRNIEERKQADEKIKAQLSELKKWQATTIGREERIIEMKKEVNTLLEKLGLQKKYNM